MALPTSRIAKLFSIANESRLHKGASESERHKARWELLLEFHSQREQLKREEITRIDRYLEQGIKDWGYRIFAEPDPIRALEIFLGDRHKRGKRAKYAERDLQITVAGSRK